MSEELQSKRRLPPPKRNRPGLKRPRTVFSLDDVTTVAPPEARENQSPSHSANNLASTAKNTSSADEKQPHRNSHKEGPWWTWPEKQHLLSDYVMGKIDNMITKAERDEERYLMNYWDETILMQQLLYNIPKVSKNGKKSNHKNNVDKGQGMEIERETETQGEKVSDKPSLEHQKPPQVQPQISAKPQSQTPKEPSTVIRRHLPKWIPKLPSESNAATDSRQLLFSVQEFEIFVIQPLVQQLPKNACQIRLLDGDDETKDSYSLKVGIPKGKDNSEDPHRCWEHLRATTEAFLRSRIAGVNLRWLLQDGASLELELSLKPLEPLGVRFSKFTLIKKTGSSDTQSTQLQDDHPPGLWINRVEPQKGLSKALGSHKAFCNGCALLEMNGTTIRDPLALRNLLVAAKATPNKPLSVKLCLSRHSDLTQIPLSKLVTNYRLQRRDGKPIDVDVYPGLVAENPGPESDVLSKTASKAVEKSNIVENVSEKQTSGEDMEQNTPSKPISSHSTVETNNRSSPQVPKKRAIGYEINRHIPNTTSNGVEKNNRSPPQVPKKRAIGDEMDPSSQPKPMSTNNTVEESNRSSPKGKKHLERRSFPQHLQIPYISKIPSTEKENNESTSRDPEPSKASKHLVHPAFLPLLETNQESKDAEKDDKESNDHYSKSPETSKKHVHPAFLDIIQPLDQPKTSENDGQDEPESPKTLKQFVHPAFLQPFQKPDQPEASEKDKDDTDRHSEVNTSNKSSDEKEDKHSDMSMSGSSIASIASDAEADTKSPNQNQNQIMGGKRTPQQEITQDSNATKTVNGNLHSSNNTQENIPTTIQDNSELEGIENQTEQKPANSTRVSDPLASPIETDTSATVHVPRKQGEKKSGQESLLKLIDNGGNEKNNSESSKIRDIGRNTTANNTFLKNMTGNHKKPFETIRRRSLGEKGINDDPTSRKSLHLEPYEVAFEANKPLGGFFMNEQGQNFQTKCTISSIFPGGQLSTRDTRIQLGTQIVAVMKGERRINVHSYRDLQKLYNDSRFNIRIIFQNSHSCKYDRNSSSDGNWSTSGSWMGLPSFGWAGGAIIENASNGNGSRSEFHPSSPVSRQRSRSLSSSSSPGSHGSISDSKMASPIVRHRAPSFSGSFSPIHEGQTTPLYGTPPASPFVAGFSPGYNRDGMGQNHQTPPLPGEKAFADAIRNKSWKDLIQTIDLIPCFTKEFVLNVLNKHHRQVDAELKKINSSTSASTGMILPLYQQLDQQRSKQLETEKKKDLEAKKKILKFYINSLYLIEKAISLPNWTEVIVQIKNLHLYQLPSRSDSRRSNVISAMVRKTSPDVDLLTLPTVSVQRQITYSENNTFCVHNNYKMSLESRMIVVAISEGDPKVDKVHCKKLGQFVLSMNDIERKCPSDGNCHTLENRLEGVGTIGYTAKRRSANVDYVVSKRRELMVMIQDQVQTMERFNSEFGTDEIQLKADIRGLDGTSLLYAAVEVMADAQLIRKLMDLGADPKLPHTKSPLDLARQHYQRCKEKITETVNRGQQVREAAAQKCSEAKQILDVLEAAAH